jgi:nucleotide-binding universal stress UspA family protein
MAIKDIVLHVGRDARQDARLEGALSLARTFEARIVGVYALSYPVLPGYVQVDIGTELIEQRMAEMRVEADAARKAFDERLEREGVGGEWRLIEGNPIDAMALSTRYGDIAVIGQADPDHPGPEDGMADELVLTAGRPIIVWPYVGQYAKLGDQVMIAWNGTREGVRALHDAMDFLIRATKVVVCTVNPRDKEHIAGADICTHLARHGITAEAHPVIAPDLAAGDALLSAAADFGIDFLVMGGYGHSRIRELALGGVTRHVLKTMTMPVLMSH